MIVKNEARVIQRCLQSARTLIDYALIVDTGSSDGTQDVVREFLQSTNLSGEVVDEPWRDFAYNRTSALAKLREKTTIDYSLMIDADQVIDFDLGFDVQKFKNQLHYDLYDVRVILGDIDYVLPQLASNNIEISYRGIIHEFRECPVGCSRGLAKGCSIRELRDPERSDTTHKYDDHASLLERALRVETDPFLIARYKYYLAQSYRDANKPELALKTYLERAELGFWNEEIFCSLYSAAGLMERLQYPADEILETYLRAYRACSGRAEALHAAARFCRTIECYDQGYKFAKKALRLPSPQGGLFVQQWIYDFGVLDEFASLAFLSGHYAECLEACIRMLRERKIPEDQRDRVRQNAHFAIEKIGSISIGGFSNDDSDFSNYESEALSPSLSANATVDSRADVTTSRYAIITPYCNEDRATLERCLNSVRRQSVPVDHIVIADGHAQAWIDQEPVRHVRLDAVHNDHGNTARGLGALLAASEGYEAVGLLDAENWLAEDHIEKCLATAAKHHGACDFVIARHVLMTPDGRQLPGGWERSAANLDPSCFLFLRSSFHVLHHWVLAPKQLSPSREKIFLAAARNNNLRSVIVADEPTVFCQPRWSSAHEAAVIELASIVDWLNSLSGDELELASKAAGSAIRDTLNEMRSRPKPISRNAPCPCGSGKRYKHCHGAALDLR